MIKILKIFGFMALVIAGLLVIWIACLFGAEHYTYKKSQIYDLTIETKDGKSILAFTVMAEDLWDATGGNIISEDANEIQIAILREFSPMHLRTPQLPITRDRVTYKKIMVVPNPSNKTIVLR